MKSIIKRLALILVPVTLILGTSSIAFGSGYEPPPPSGGQVVGDTSCVSPSGEAGVTTDPLNNDLGDMTITTDGYAVVDFWWRGYGTSPDSPEWHTYLPAGTYQVLRPDIVVTTVWFYPNTCTTDQVTDLFYKHLAARQATGGNIGGYVPWDQTMIFVVDPSVQPAPQGPYQPPTGLLPDPGTTYAGTDPLVDPNVGLCPTDQNIYGDLLDVCVDDTNPALMAGNCFEHQEYALEGGPEVSTSAAYLSVRYPNREGKLVWALGSHGIWNVAGRIADDAWVKEYGVNCTFNEVLALLAADIQAYPPDQVALNPLISFTSTRLFGLEDDQIPYFGGLVNPDTDPNCHAEKLKGGRLGRHPVIGKDGFYVNVEPWVPGQVAEHELVLDPGQWNVAANVDGSFWYYNASICTRGQVEAQARAEAHRRHRHGNIGFFERDRFGLFSPVR